MYVYAFLMCRILTYAMDLKCSTVQHRAAGLHWMNIIND